MSSYGFHEFNQGPPGVGKKLVIVLQGFQLTSKGKDSGRSRLAERPCCISCCLFGPEDVVRELQGFVFDNLKSEQDLQAAPAEVRCSFIRRAFSFGRFDMGSCRDLYKSIAASAKSDIRPRHAHNVAGHRSLRQRRAGKLLSLDGCLGLKNPIQLAMQVLLRCRTLQNRGFVNTVGEAGCSLHMRRYVSRFSDPLRPVFPGVSGVLRFRQFSNRLPSRPSTVQGKKGQSKLAVIRAQEKLRRQTKSPWTGCRQQPTSAVQTDRLVPAIVGL